MRAGTQQAEHPFAKHDIGCRKRLLAQGLARITAEVPLHRRDAIGEQDDDVFRRLRRARAGNGSGRATTQPQDENCGCRQGLEDRAAARARVVEWVVQVAVHRGSPIQAPGTGPTLQHNARDAAGWPLLSSIDVPKTLSIPAAPLAWARPSR